MSRLIDISPLLSPRTAVWPGDVPLQQKFALNMSAGDNIDLSSMQTTVHIGAHTDAPRHYQLDGADIASRSLSLYYGPCQVIAVDVGRGERIGPQHITVPPIDERVIFKTGTFPDPDTFSEDFAACSAALIEHLASCGVRLVGIDTPSIDLFADKVLQSHNAVAAADMAILEGVVLDDVTPGLYTLIALPLRLEGADASPVRAVLVSEES